MLLLGLYPDLKADMMSSKTPENIALMEPMRIPDGKYPELTDLAFELTKRSAELRSRLPMPLLESLSSLVRSMNCYYSNLIEGHNTHPVDIERALANDYSNDQNNSYKDSFAADFHLGLLL